MKSLVVVLLVVISATSSLTAASDTLRVISYRTIDVCSSEQRWLIAASIGQVYNSDSLQSFDITIGYDTSRFTPTDGLISGTLSEQMRFGDLSPFFNFAIPGEMRVGAFTVTRNVVGDLPLFAIAGTYEGSCGDADTFSLPWVPDFNGEFKTVISTFASDTVLALATATDDPSQGSSIELDTLQLQGMDSSGVFDVSITQSEMVGLRIVDHVNLVADDLFAIDSVSTTASIDSVVVSEGGQSVRIYRVVETIDDVTFNVHVTSLTDSRDTLTRALAHTEMLSACGCVTPSKEDELVLRSQHITTAVHERDVHENTDLRISQSAQAIELQCSHGQPWRVILVDVIGKEYISTDVYPGTVSRLSLNELPHGTYILQATNGRKIQGMTIAK